MKNRPRRTGASQDNGSPMIQRVGEFVRRSQLELILFFSLFLTYSYFSHLQPGWNVNSRLALTYAIVDKGTFRIDDYHAQKPYETQDKAFYKGHYYSDKIIGTSLLGVPAYAVLKVFSGVFGFELTPNVRGYVVRVFSVSLLAALGVVVLFRILLLFGATKSEAVVLSYFFSFGTLYLPYATLFYSYAPALFFSLLAYHATVKWRIEGRLDEAPLFAIGLAAGGALLCEYTLAIVWIALAVYLVLQLKRKRGVLSFVAGSFVVLSIFLIYTQVCFESFTVPYRYEENRIFSTGMRRGFLGITSPNLAVLYYITVHPYRGLFFYSPVLLLYFFGVMWLDREPRLTAVPDGRQVGRQRWRPEALFSLCIVFGYLLFNASYYMWWGGWAMGARHLLPMIPFMIPALIWVLRKNQWYAGLVYLAGGLSIFLTFIPTAVDPQMPQRYHTAILLAPRVSDNLSSPMLHEEFPAFFQGDIAWNIGKIFHLPKLASLLPLAVMWIAAVLILRGILRRRREPQL
jgi:hypothetical protein